MNSEIVNSWKETASGLAAQIPCLRKEDVTIEDIAHALSNVCRFGGHCRKFYSVAQHSIYVACHLRDTGYSHRIQLLGLLHDAPEAYTGDVITPVKLAIPAFREFEMIVAKRVFDALGMVDYVREDWGYVKDADEFMLAVEAYHLMPTRGVTWTLKYPPEVGERYPNFTPWRPGGESKRIFAAMYRHLLVEIEAEDDE